MTRRISERRTTPISVPLSLCMSLALLALGACGGNGSRETRLSREPGRVGESAFPVSVKHKLGTTEVPSEPRRIVALGGTDGDIAQALGVTPVAVPRYFNSADGLSPWLKSKLGGARVQLLEGGGGEGSASGGSLEAVAALRPDIILATTYFELETQYDKLAEIAPVIAYQRGPLEDSWQEQALSVGRALGKEEQARKLVSQVEGEIQQIKRDHPEFAGKTLSYSFHFEPGAIQTINDTNDFAAKVVGDLGLRLAPGVDALEGDQGARISLESIQVLDADVLVMAYASEDLRASLERSPLFRGISAVSRGDYIALSVDAITALRIPSALSVPYGLEELVPGLAKALSD